MVAGWTLKVRATSLTERPSCRSRAASSRWSGLSLDGRPKLTPRHRQVAAGEDKEAPLLIGATASCGSLDARDLGPDREGLRADGSVLGGREVIAVEMEEVVDLIMGREEPLRLAG